MDLQTFLLEESSTKPVPVSCTSEPQLSHVNALENQSKIASLAGFRQERHGYLPLQKHLVTFISAQGTRF